MRPDESELEPEDAGECDIPTELVELHEVLAWQEAVEAQADGS